MATITRSPVLLLLTLASGVYVGGLGLPATAAAQSEELMKIYREGNALYKAGRYDKALPLHLEAAGMGEQEFGPDHPHTAMLLNNLAEVYRRQGRYADAEPLHKRSLAIRETALGPDHPHVAVSLNAIALLHKTLGRYGEAEPLYKRSLAIRENALGPHHRKVAIGLNNLAVLYRSQGRYGEAEPLYKRSLAIREKAVGPDHPDVAMGLNNLALLYDYQGRYGDAEPLYKRSLAIWEKTLGPDHPEVGTSLNNLALLYGNQGRYSDAEPLYRRALSISEKALGADHADVATSLHALATLYDRQKRYGDAEPLYKRALAITEKALGPDHPDVTPNLNNLAMLHERDGRYSDALMLLRRASSIHRKRAAKSVGQLSGGNLREQKSVRVVFVNHVRTGYNVAENTSSTQPDLIAETFEIGQMAMVTSTAAAVAGMGARFAAGDDALAGLVRERQDAAELWQRIDKKILATVSLPPAKRDKQAELKLHADLSDLDFRIGALNERLASDFPEYAELASPKPVSLSEIQRLLGPKEALLSYLVGEEESFLWTVRKDNAEIMRIAVGQEDLAQSVTELRRSLDPTVLTRLSDIPSFDTTRSFELYSKIFAPAEPLLKGVRHVFFGT